MTIKNVHQYGSVHIGMVIIYQIFQLGSSSYVFSLPCLLALRLTSSRQYIVLHMRSVACNIPYITRSCNIPFHRTQCSAQNCVSCAHHDLDVIIQTITVITHRYNSILILYLDHRFFLSYQTFIQTNNFVYIVKLLLVNYHRHDYVGNT